MTLFGNLCGLVQANATPLPTVYGYCYRFSAMMRFRMGSFLGHVLPGSMFLLFGLWWTLRIAQIRFYTSGVSSPRRPPRRRKAVPDPTGVRLAFGSHKYPRFPVESGATVSHCLWAFRVQDRALDAIDDSGHRHRGRAGRRKPAGRRLARRRQHHARHHVRRVRRRRVRRTAHALSTASASVGLRLLHALPSIRSGGHTLLLPHRASSTF